MKHIPNILSFIRLALCPVFIITFFEKTPSEAFWIFALASCLDVIDGFIARRFNAITVLGKILDPVADKVLQLSAMVCFTVKDLIPFFAIIVILVVGVFAILFTLYHKYTKNTIVSQKKSRLL